MPRRRKRKRKPRPVAEVEDDLARAREDLERYEAWKRYTRQYSEEHERYIVAIESQITQLRQSKSNYQTAFFGVVRTDELLPEAQQRLTELEAEVALRRNQIDNRLPPVPRPPYPNGRCMMSDYYTAVRTLEQELADAQILERRKSRQRANRAQIASATGKSRDLATQIKSELLEDHPCPYCGGALGSDPHADHIYPVSKGGQSRVENMVYVCNDCNSKKRDFTLNVFIAKYGLDRAAIQARLDALGKEY